MDIHRNISFLDEKEIPDNFILKSIDDDSIIKGESKNRWFKLIDCDELNINDFIFILGTGLFQISSIEETNEQKNLDN